MIYKKVPTTLYYLEHEEELINMFPQLPLKKIQLIKNVENGKPRYSEKGTLPMQIFRNMFELNKFIELKACEMNILNTTEYGHLNDYDTLEYNEKLCSKLIDNSTEKKERKWSRIYYSDFETDTTLSPHVQYLNCTVYREAEYIHKITITGENIGEKLLYYLCNGSLTYFHNLKYDACFFVNCPGWNTEITERSGTVLQIVMTKYEQKEWIDKKTKTKKSYRSIQKQLVFRNSYSIIPSSLANFAKMFNLDVHKEIMAYKLYTQKNIQRVNVSAIEFQLQYFKENRDKLTLKEIQRDWKQLIENAKEASAFDEEHLMIDIMKYAIFYCKKDCVVLMKGIEKFDRE